MKEIDKTIFERAFAAQETILAEGTGSKESSGEFNINWSDICTKLIQETGRFCEGYASDIVSDIKTIEENIKNPKDKPVFVICGIRKNGVDHDDYILSELNQHGHISGYSELHYRKTLAVKIEKIKDEAYDSEKLVMTLKDIGSELGMEVYKLR